MNEYKTIMERNLKIFATTVEPGVYGQIERMMSLDAFREAKVRIMPDTHSGVGCVIGFTANLGDKVVPNLVGVDIGCGMYVKYLGKMNLTFLPVLDKFIHENIPSGSDVNTIQGTRVEFPELKDMVMYRHLRNVEHLQSSIGSLGGGNHFIELDQAADGGLYLVIHTGSRNLGQQVCKHYQKLAIDTCNNHKAKIKEEIKRVTGELRASGHAKDIAKAIDEIKARYHNIAKLPADLCYLTGQEREDYLHDMRLCQEFARRNREEIGRRIFKLLKKYGAIDGEEWHTIHNYIDFSDNIIRKGAIRCNAGEKVIVPLNMRDGSILAIGKGNENWNNSGPHGAGRLMSRSAAKESISMQDFKASMTGIYTTSVNRNTLDESPMAYKNAQEIIDAVGDTMDIIEVIKPVYNFKASETEDDYKRNQ